VSTTTCIEWTDTTWNPVTGCTKVSPGCDHCYAEKITERFHGTGSFATITLHPDRLDTPLQWRTPRRVFVNSMSDLFHPHVPDEFLARVFAGMAATPQHTYQILTKRHARMRSLLSRGDLAGWPLPHVWLGVSVEDQKRAELRIPALIQTPAAVRFLSCEPLLGPVDLSPWLGSRHQCPGELMPPGSVPARARTVDCCTNPALDWVIIGGESGPGARPMHPDWARALLDQCQAAGVAVFVKQLGSVWARHHRTDPKGAGWSRWPQVLRVRDYPRAGAR
jgi:protein gp37